MDFRQLRYFVEVAVAENFREAAQRLNVSQSSLSRRVADLEYSLKAQLFERHPRGVTLTEAGRQLLARAEAILRDVDAIRSEIGGQSEVPAGVVTVGASPSISRMLLARLAQSFEPDYPRLRLRFVEGAQYALFEGLDTARIDLAVLVTPEPIPSCTLEPLTVEQLYLLSSKPILPKRRMMRVTDLDRVPLALFPRPSGHRNYLDRVARENGVQLAVRYEIADTTAQINFVRHGLCSALLPFSAVGDGKKLRGLTAVPLADLVLTRTLVFRNDRYQSTAVAAVAEAIRSMMRTIASEQGLPEAIRPLPIPLSAA